MSLKWGCTWASMAPFCLKALAGQPIPPDHRYRFFGNGICETPWDKLFGVKTIGWWGMTETITHGTVGNPHFPDAPMSMGRPSPAYRIHVLDESGRPVKPGETGDLYVEGQRGLSLFLEYAGDPEATARAFTPVGLFITGDRAGLCDYVRQSSSKRRAGPSRSKSPSRRGRRSRTGCSAAAAAQMIGMAESKLP